MKLLFHGGKQPIEVEVETGAAKRTTLVNGRKMAIELLAGSVSAGTVLIDGARVRYLAERRGTRVRVALRGECHELDLSGGGSSAAGRPAGAANPETRSPMPGKVLEVRVEEGDRVEPGSPLLVLEAMKMENLLGAEVSGTVARILVGHGDLVEPGQLLVVVETEEPVTNDVS